MEKSETREKLLLIDANSLIHRSFHALPPFKTPDGHPSGALYGLASVLIKVLRERPPKYAAAAFDRPEPTLREKEYKEYKATRTPTPNDLIVQLKEAHNLFGAFGIKTFDLAGFEADDIVATMAEKFEVTPEKLADYKGLVGDTSDNIPGVPGIGPKTASKLIKEFGTLEKMFEDIEEIGMSDERLRRKLVDYKDQALMSKRLATLNTNVDIKVELEDIDITKSFLKEKAILYAKKLGSNTLESRIENDLPQRYNA